MPAVEICPVHSRGELRAFVKFPWRVYRGDRNWVPPLISDRLQYLDPTTGPFYKTADVSLFLARRNREVLGTIAAFVNHPAVERLGPIGGFGFFETVDDFAVAKALLDAAADWLRVHRMAWMRGPTSFTETEYPGVLIAGADCPPAMLENHTPPYYKELLERYGMEKDHDLYAWRAFRWQVGEELKNIPPQLLRAAEAARRAANVTIRKIRMTEWDQEVAQAHRLFNVTLSHLPEHVPMSAEEFRRMADPLRMFIDPDLALFAEVDGRPVGFCVALPDINRVLLRLNGRLFPFGWLMIRRYIRQVNVVTFKLMGVLEEYRHRGIDALLYLETIKAFYEKGYEWLDGSLTSEHNPTINLLAQRLGAECYKHYRIYRIKL